MQLILVVCYLPQGKVNLIFLTYELLSPFIFIVRTLTVTLVCLNSSLNPIIYCFISLSIVRRVYEDEKSDGDFSLLFHLFVYVIVKSKNTHNLEKLKLER